MACKESEGKCFTFLWKLENISFCLQKKGERIESPAFTVDAIDQTRWKLWLYPRGEKDGNHIGYFLHREADSKSPDKVEIKYELAFIAKDESVLQSWNTKNYVFSKDSGRGVGRVIFEKREDVFISRRSAFLPQDTLTASCRMWKCDGEMTEDVRCTARTRIGVQRRSFLWNVENFSTLESDEKYTCQIKSLENDAPLMSVDLSLTGGLSSSEIIRFELSLQDQTIKFASLQLSLLDASGNRVECNEDEFWFDNHVKCKQFTFIFTKKKLLAKKSTYLPDDVLSLHWEWVFSKGVVLEETDEVRYGSTTFENKISDDQNANNEKIVPLLHTFNDNLKSLYDEHFFSDIKLKTSTSVFPAHKVILGASSSVFKAMFLSDMKEKDSDCVDIQDLSDDAVRRMLLYIYTARVEDLTWESASNLYVIADMYAVLSLKNICSSFLKNNLSPGNACEVLLLADFHADCDLKSAVQDYILKYDKDIINSDEWKLLMETNGKLAAETLCLRYK
ncbi:Speckle-type POZ protein B [Araneus ventricosus]|uniref:Speckle-type POZ protein B n=1 Tax=Araneus ventricosus TaxID=182803 RepID=A0A4Y2D6R7_ARAVE|nr:Speckle-type POZ protein B [Araneus ventricosus]